ncbi:hypothetical protein [Muribaculum intestinale]|uniref:hypothetical protein n=5 Tax=Muribaculum intestinale TaxID=1796646 RepID=UPI0025B6772F|nr:hypothetical protein [Muribaculum intestinale]
MNALAIHLYLTIRHINLSFNYFGNFYRIIVICDTKFKNNLEINARDLIRELNIEKVKVQRKLNKSYSNVRNWSKLIGVVSAGLSLGAIFNHPTIAAVGGIGIFASQTIEQVNDYFHKKYNWVNFVNQRIGKI